MLICSNEYDIIFLDIEMPEAFKVKAFRFLAEPLNEEHLKEAITDAQKELADSKKIIISNFGREILTDIKDIMYIRADGKNTVIHMENGEIETGYPLKYWIGEFGSFDFCQVHKS